MDGSLKVVIPGDIIPIQTDNENATIILGPGLRQDVDNIVAMKAGILQNNGNRWWIESNQKRVNIYNNKKNFLFIYLLICIYNNNNNTIIISHFVCLFNIYTNVHMYSI